MSSPKPLVMTFTEDDLRIPSRTLQKVKEDSIPTVTRSRSKSPIVNIPIQRATRVPFLEEDRKPLVRPSTEERRRQVKEILDEEEREFRQREKLRKKNEAYLREQLSSLKIVGLTIVEVKHNLF